jgi:hypothetical protein
MPFPHAGFSYLDLVAFKCPSYLRNCLPIISEPMKPFMARTRTLFLFLIFSVSGGTQTCDDMSGDGGANPLPMPAATEGNAASGPLLCKFIDSSGQDITRQLTQQPINKKTKKTTAKIASRRPSANSDASAVVAAVTDGDSAAVNCEGVVDSAPTIDTESKGRTTETKIVDGLKLFPRF